MRDKSAEDLRVEAESGRVTAEKGRVVNEFGDEKGRVVAEKGRVSAEESRARNAELAAKHAAEVQAAFEEELAALREDPDHYMTPGARRYFRRVALGYIILAIGMTFGIKALADNVDENLRSDLNKLGEAQCLGSIPTLNKFNSLVEIQIESNRASRAIATREGDDARVALTASNIVKLQEAKLRVPNAKECSAPILK